MSILYFLIADKQTQRNIGTHIDNKLLSDEALEEIKQKAADLLSTDTSIEKCKRYKVELQHTSLFYYLSLPSTLYISAVSKGSPFTLKDNFIFELIEDVDSQGIRKLVDKQGHLIKVALQNLRYSIDKYQSFQLDSNEENGKHSEIFEQTPLVVPPSEVKVIEDTPITPMQSEDESTAKPSLLKSDDIVLPKRSIKLNKRVYIAIGFIIALMLIAIVIVYKR